MVASILRLTQVCTNHASSKKKFHEQSVRAGKDKILNELEKNNKD